jgi:hypothetical protein
MKKLTFLDCESAGLRGEVFAAALVDQDGAVLFDGFFRHPDLETNPWLKENVAPNLTGTEFKSLGEFQESFAKVWLEHKDCPCVTHMGAPVEANFFQQLWEAGLIGEFEGPYPMLDTATLLYMIGEDPTSEIAFLNKLGYELPKGKPHSALFDALVTRMVWMRIVPNN